MTSEPVVYLKPFGTIMHWQWLLYNLILKRSLHPLAKMVLRYLGFIMITVFSNYLFFARCITNFLHFSKTQWLIDTSQITDGSTTTSRKLGRKTIIAAWIFRKHSSRCTFANPVSLWFGTWHLNRHLHSLNFITATCKSYSEGWTGRVVQCSGIFSQR